MKINFIYIFITLSPILFSSCAGDGNIRQIKMDESLMIIDDMNKYSFDKVFMDRNNYLIINDTLLLPDTVDIDSVKTIWTAHRLSLKDYAKNRNIESIALDKFKNLPLFLRQPLLRIILWSPLIFLDIIDDRTGYSETPSYLLYLFNDGLLPMSSLLLEPLNHIENFQYRLIYSNFALWIGFAMIQVLILFGAERIVKIENWYND